MNKKELAKRLDRLVSILVRGEECFCASCGKPLLWRKRQAGHFIPRAVKATRWDLRNVHVQCAKCNVELGGNLDGYCLFMCKKYGEDFVWELEQKYTQYKQGELKEPSYREMVALYNQYLDQVDREVERNSALIPKEWEKIN